MDKAKSYRKKVLIVEDDQDLSTVISRKLIRLNLDVHQVYRGQQAKDELLRKAYDLALVDIGLPDANGHKIVSSLREAGVKTPMVVITNNVKKDDEIISYKSGANLFHAKPIDFDVLESQIKGLLALHAPQNEIMVGDLVLDGDRRALIIDDKEFGLSFKEFELIKLLLSNPGKIFSREQVIRYTFKGVYEPQPSSVDTLISRLRKKLGKISDLLIETVHGVGFKLGQKYTELQK